MRPVLCLKIHRNLFYFILGHLYLNNDESHGKEPATRSVILEPKAKGIFSNTGSTFIILIFCSSQIFELTFIFLTYCIKI